MTAKEGFLKNWLTPTQQEKVKQQRRRTGNQNSSCRATSKAAPCWRGSDAKRGHCPGSSPAPSVCSGNSRRALFITTQSWTQPKSPAGGWRSDPTTCPPAAQAACGPVALDSVHLLALWDKVNFNTWKSTQSARKRGTQEETQIKIQMNLAVLKTRGATSPRYRGDRSCRAMWKRCSHWNCESGDGGRRNQLWPGGARSDVHSGLGCQGWINESMSHGNESQMSHCQRKSCNLAVGGSVTGKSSLADAQ